MRVVNLSGKPFLNRRPVARVAAILWVLGALLLALNVWLYATYLSGTTQNRARLAELNQEIDAAEDRFDQLGRRLGEVNLGQRNQRAAFLNDLIDQRTFPWSRLFDDLEDVLHEDVFLSLVSPKVQVEEPGSQRASRPRSRSMTPREARRAAQGRQGDRGQAAIPTPESANVAEEPDFEIVELTLQGTARNDEALLDFVDALYESESFVDPFLSTEMRDEGRRDTQFAITTYYLLPRKTAEPSTAGDPESGADRVAADRVAADRVAADQAKADGSDAAPVGDGAAAEDRVTNDRVADDGDARSEPSSSEDSAGKTSGPTSSSPATSEPTASNATPPATPSDRPSQRRTLSDRAGDSASVRQPGVPTDRRRPETLRDRSPGIPGAETGADGAEAGGRQAEPTLPERTQPELTQPGASASPRLRRVGSLRIEELFSEVAA